MMRRCVTCGGFYSSPDPAQRWDEPSCKPAPVPPTTSRVRGGSQDQRRLAPALITTSCGIWPTASLRAPSACCLAVLTQTSDSKPWNITRTCSAFRGTSYTPTSCSLKILTMKSAKRHLRETLSNLTARYIR